MPDLATIQNTIKKRFKAVLVVDPVMCEFIDAIGVAVCVTVGNVAYPMTFKLRRGCTRGEVLNVCDGIDETMKRIKRERPSIAEYLAGRKLLVVTSGLASA